jgi:hypothetical protein
MFASAAKYKNILVAVAIAVAAIVVIFWLLPSGEAFSAGTIGTVVKETPVLIEPESPPYETRPIMSVADYDDTGDSAPNPLPYDDPVRSAMEVEVIARSSAEKVRAVKRERLNAQQFEVARLPPDSQVRAVAEEGWASAAAAAPVSAAGAGSEGFADIQGTALQPEDKDALEAQERAILATYVPKKSADLLTYSIEDTEDLIKKIYDGREQVPSYKQRADGVWEVYEVADKEPKIVWEDDVAMGTAGAAAAAAPGDYITVPIVAQQMAANLDPFFEPRTRLTENRADYVAFTPELERMFAPTEPRLNWY